ncbi:uncharacterized protein N7459_006666 [Penicillium hispanicum]|uniref:uncharacterized protein n=1 Tax=Penicillium hispanicum TaxID=1080232 RepID=UPI0025417674|nr:uncharacterized protein N7459_006666 [Penicillium hispanicum]KAJ5577702.1 hypothetical protein N7459_006666 [Penicillium hispanicum]
MNAAQFESKRYDLMVTLNAWASSTQYVPPDAMAAALERWAHDVNQFKTLSRQARDPYFLSRCDHIKWAMTDSSQRLRRERRLTRDIASRIRMVAVDMGRLVLD